jgi:hypothetical protein
MIDRWLEMKALPAREFEIGTPLEISAGRGESIPSHTLNGEMTVKTPALAESV